MSEGLEGLDYLGATEPEGPVVGQVVAGILAVVALAGAGLAFFAGAMLVMWILAGISAILIWYLFVVARTASSHTVYYDRKTREVVLQIKGLGAGIERFQPNTTRTVLEIIDVPSHYDSSEEKERSSSQKYTLTMTIGALTITLAKGSSTGPEITKLESTLKACGIPSSRTYPEKE